MIRIIYNKNLLALSGLSVVVLLCVVLFTPVKAFADTCGVMADPDNPKPSWSSGNCQEGQKNSNALGSLSENDASDLLKEKFIKYIKTKLASGYRLWETTMPDGVYYYQQRGAEYIIKGLGGSDWEARVNNSSVVLKIENYSYKTNTYYDEAVVGNAANGTDIYSLVVVKTYNEEDTRKSLVFYVDGIAKYAIKYDCGNPVNALPGLPSPPWAIEGRTTVSSPTAEPGATVTFQHYIKNNGPGATTMAIWSDAWAKDNGGDEYQNKEGKDQGVLSAGTEKEVEKNADVFTIPSDAANGTQYCRRVGYAPYSSTAPSTSPENLGKGNWTCVTVTISDKAPTITLTGDCSGLKVTAKDDDSPKTQLKVEIWAGEKGASGSTRLLGPKATTSNSLSYNPRPTADLKSVKFYAYATGVDKTGVENGVVISASAAVGPCDKAPTVTASATCTTISGKASDADNLNKELAVKIYKKDTTTGSNILLVSTTTNKGEYSYYKLAEHTLLTNTKFIVIVLGVDQGGNVNKVTTEASASAGPCNTAKCGARLDMDVAVGLPVKLNPTVNVAGWGSPPYTPNTNPKFNVTITGPLPSTTIVTGSGDWNYTVNSNSLTATGQFTPTTQGQYKVVWKLIGSGDAAVLNITCDGDGYINEGPDTGDPITPDGGGIINAGYAPYFTATGGDVVAGSAFCGGTSNNAADVKSWNTDGASSMYSGASSNLAVIATGGITSFATGTNSATGLPTVIGASVSPPSALAFANNGTYSTNTYGGNFKSPPCTKFHAEDVASPTSLGSGDFITNLSPVSLPDNAYMLDNGNLTINAATLAGKRNLTIYVNNGNVYIAGNIKYSYTSISEIPRLNIYVNGGNIIVGKDVTEIHGLFEVKSDGANGGTFYSCGTASGPVEYAGANSLGLNSNYSNCNKQLKIYGAVVADKLVLTRNHGSYVAAGTVVAEPAEQFIFTPELWLAPEGQSQSGKKAPVYDHYVELPPVL